MSFLWNFFTSPKEPEKEKPKVEEKKNTNINDFEFILKNDEEKQPSIPKKKNIKNEDMEPIDEMQKDDLNINKVQLKENKEQKKPEVVIKEKIEEKKEEKENEENKENKEEERDIIQANINDTNIEAQPKKVKTKKEGKGKKKKAENKEEQNINIIREESNKILNLEINNEPDSTTFLISNQSSDSQLFKRQIHGEIKKFEMNKKIILEGPENSPYENGKFEISIDYENNADMKPILKCITKIYHYNISQKDGEILCPFIWNKNNNEDENIKNIKALLLRPDTRFPCSKFIKEEYYNNYPSYKEKAQKFTENYAMN